MRSPKTMEGRKERKKKKMEAGTKGEMKGDRKECQKKRF